MRPAYPGRGPASAGPATHAAEIEALATERFAAVGQTLLSALADSGLSARRAANVLSWFVVAQLALGPWRSRGEVRPGAVARSMGVSRWTEWRARRDAVSAGVIRDWSLPDPEARGYGRGAVRVVELAFVRTRAVTQKVAAIKEERHPRRAPPRGAQAGEGGKPGRGGDGRRRGAWDSGRPREAPGADLADRRAALGDGAEAPALRGFDRRGASAPESTAGVAAARAAVPRLSEVTGASP